MGGYDLIALIFVREVSDPLTGLVKTIDKQLEEAYTRHKGEKFGVFVIFLSDDPGSMKPALQSLVAKAGLRNVVLSTHNKAAGPPAYHVAPDAEVTVAIYQGHDRAAANFVFDAVDLTRERTGEIMLALKRVLP